MQHMPWQEDCPVAKCCPARSMLAAFAFATSPMLLCREQPDNGERCPCLTLSILL